MRARALGLSFLFVALATGTASAQSPEDKARAKEAYTRGLEAHKKGDYQRAATEFAKADAYAPSNVALQAAIDAAVDADDPALGSELVERSARSPVSGELAKSVETAKKKFAGRAGRLVIGCPSGSTCLATLDGAAAPIGKPTWARSGQHTVVVQVDGEAQTKLVEVVADKSTDVTPTKKSAPTPPAPPPATPAATPNATPNATPAPATPTPTPTPTPSPSPEPPKTKKGLSPIVFWIGAGSTVALGGVSTALGFMTKGKHDDFTKAHCDTVGSASCQALKDDGQNLQNVTNVGFGVTILAGVATAVIGVAFTDWSGGEPRANSAPLLAPIAGGAMGGWGGRF